MHRQSSTARTGGGGCRAGAASKKPQSFFAKNVAGLMRQPQPLTFRRGLNRVSKMSFVREFQGNLPGRARKNSGPS